ncbi:ABC transporter ATP-binding protein [Companilactobacillus sp.]|jgi:ABC-2 type transport system ATP-binding protein|uniref:ABC transporter ATP-binding protein n=1 Tax=Companilactobacillus sp. TaxID=2767905 RepID=UPI0025C360E0|nr:ABC transporter ATP-binding protein [Companilactobacillus sp.]MCH4009112.1 ABC transporter ATP-binding protein [Companilactobacillus sp.]MCH4050709.1 ABC transporter ATP-binding protein [Companilactobacillus sp.]MCH4077054.1 ABC transporter ATP-binding protein [Companilactobacillus sp.]MCH4125630.1 ABC transporter ATP-binding protein [Companilactobacillus sp.]MCI1311339.1 ABC transporter ATP-binding protein [Companilactobacillus sp.]
MDDVIEVKNVSKSFGKKQILNNISFSVPKGQIIALLGENGAGKTTLINIILGLISKNIGDISILGKKSSQSKNDMGVMMQNDITLTRIKVKEVIKLYQSYYERHLSYQEILNIAKLNQQENLFLKQLSGGQRRRLSFALSMTGDPAVLFLDEPTNGMDPISRQNFWDEIIKLKKLGKTIFVTSHHLNELENVIDRFLILRDQQIIFDGSLADLRTNSGKTQISFDSELDLMVFETLESIDHVSQTGNHFIVLTTNTNQVVSELTPLLTNIQNLKISQNSLENIFITLNQGDLQHA